MKVKNPILRGFNPDPSIIRVGEDYYIATSTFEWFPGVQIHHSKDLVNWELIAHPLNRFSQLDMRGNPDSCGVWAPCLSHENGVFYLVYSNVRSFDGIWKDTPNYLVTTKDIRGEWSEPIFLNSSGFDGSMFHDEDGKKYYLSMLVDHRKGKFFGGIILQEYDSQKEKLFGPVHHIFKGTELGLTEGPHLYKKDGWYYLITAEGGTEYGHAVSLARSKDILGPYEVHPKNPLVSSRGNPESVLQKTGHADMVEAPNGKWYITFLVGRPLSKLGRCTLGRESTMEELEWKEDGWPYLKNGGRLSREEFEIDGVQAIVSSEINQSNPGYFFDQFDSLELNIHFQSLRIPITEKWLSLSAKKGWLTLYGRESLSSFHHQSLIAKRVQHFNVEVSTCLNFSPENFQQMAGLVCYYNTYHWHYLHVMGGENGERYLNVISCDKYEMMEPIDQPVLLNENGLIYLKVKFNKAEIQFSFSENRNDWKKVGPVLDGSILSDDYVRDETNRYRPAFTGSFIGLCCQDLSGNNHPAFFDFFEYQEIND